MKIMGMLILVLTCVALCPSQEKSPQTDATAGLVVVKVKRERRREQPTDVRNTATDPDALNNGGVMPSGPGGNFPTFINAYSAEVRNDSLKTIKWLVWVYVLIDESKEELDRQEFSSFNKIGSGQKKTLNGTKKLPPMLSGTGERKPKNGSAFHERVEFVCVAYDDGSLWHPAFIPESHCRDAEKRGKSR